jgi:hypothetical protein
MARFSEVEPIRLETRVKQLIAIFLNFSLDECAVVDSRGHFADLKR